MYLKSSLITMYQQVPLSYSILHNTGCSHGHLFKVEKLALILHFSSSIKLNLLNLKSL